MRAGMDYCTCTLHFAIISTRLTEKFDEKGPEKEASGPISLSPPCGMHEALMRGHLEMKIVFDRVGILQIPSLKEATLALPLVPTAHSPPNGLSRRAKTLFIIANALAHLFQDEMQ